MSYNDWESDGPAFTPREEDMGTDPVTGIRTVHIYRVNPVTNKNERIVRRTRTEVKKVREYEAVLARASWQPFGGGAEGKVQPLRSAEEIYIQRPVNTDAVQETTSAPAPPPPSATGGPGLSMAPGGVMCRNCGGPHWTMACKSKGGLADPLAAPGGAGGPGGPGGGPGGGGGGSYVPPHKQAGALAAAAATSETGIIPEHLRRELRVFNIDPDVSEAEFRALVMAAVGQKGGLERIRMPPSQEDRSQHTGRAYITFYDNASAKAALAELDGYVGLGRLRLEVKLSDRDPNFRPGGGSGFDARHLSGYGKQLPQNLK